MAANDRVTREALGLLSGESLSVQRHARELLIPQAGNFSTLKRMAIMIASALDEGRQRGSVHQHAQLWHMYRVVESAALSETRDLEFSGRCWGYPIRVGWLGRVRRRSSLQDWLPFIAIAVLSMRHVVDVGEQPDAGVAGTRSRRWGTVLDEQRPGRLPRPQRGPRSRPGSSSRTWEKEVVAVGTPGPPPRAAEKTNEPGRPCSCCP